MTARRRRLLACTIGLVTVAFVSVAYAQGAGDGPTSVVMTGPPGAEQPWSINAGDLSWPVAAYGVVHRFLSVLERMVTDTRGWLDRWLDKTGGRLKIDHKKTLITYASGGAGPEDNTGPIPMSHRRKVVHNDDENQ